MPEKIITKEGLAYFKGKYDDQMDDVLAGKQATLVSGENIKTINNESILGSGNITISGGGGSAPYEVQDYQLDTSEEMFECSDADAEYIFTNNPTAISLGGTIAVARDFTDDESKNDYSRSYVFFEFPDDNQVIYYELGFYWDGEEYSFDIKPTDPIGGGGEDKLVLIEASLVSRTNVETIAMTSTWGSEGDFYQIAVSSYPSAIPDKVVVNYNNGESVEIPKTGAAPGGQAYIYGNMNEFGQPDFTTYPFCVGISIDQGFTSIVAPNDDATDVSIDAYIAADGEYDVQMPSGVTKATILSDIANGKVPVLHVSIPDGNDSFWCYSVEVVDGEIKFSGESDSQSVTIESDSNSWSITLSTMPVPVSGTNDGTNWTTLTIDGTTKNIPVGGGGGGEEKVYPIAITANPGVGDTLLAAAQNLTMDDMPDAPGYTYAPYTLESDINYTEPYDAVLVEFHAGQQYLLPLVQADSGTALYGEVDGTGMPIFDNYPAAVVFLLNSGSLSSVMLVSNVASGTLVATSLHGYVFSETTFSLNANGITSSDIDTAVAAGKVPVAVVDWIHKDYKSWCPAEVRYDESNRAYYKFGGEYKDKEFTINNDGSSWSLAWITSAVKDVELIVDIDNANNKVYFRSLNDMRTMQSALPIVTLKLYDHTSHDFSGYLELMLSTQNSTETSIYYSSAQVADSGKGTITTLRVNSTDTLASGSYIFTADVSTVYTANITLAQDYSKMYFTDADLTYLKNHVPFAIKAIWDDGEGHSGSFVMNLSTTQEGGQADMPRIYSMMMIEGGTLSVMSLKIDGGYTSSTGCPIEMYSPQ